MARTTLAQYAATTDARLESIEAGIAQLLAASVTADQPARTRKAQPKADRKPVTSAKALTKRTRKAFIAASEYDFAGWSTKDIAHFCVEQGYAPKGFVIGEGYTALFS